jgi:hypothetical protein
MKRLILGMTALVSSALWIDTASAANPYRDRHFTHYALHDAFELQDFHRHSYASGYPATVWSRRATLDQVTPVPPIGELPPVPLPPRYEYRRRDYEYERTIIRPGSPIKPGSPAAYPVSPLPPGATRDTSPSDIISPWRSRTGQPGHSSYAP